MPDPQDDGYWFGVKVRSREEGLFPGNYVAEHDPASTPTTTVRLSTPLCTQSTARLYHIPLPPVRAVVGDGRGGRHGASSRECSQVFAGVCIHTADTYEMGAQGVV